ncbi:macrophage mannose receptor 1-like [Archocentrus centrarchus]|uniref:macrophage mannose receptor 1-like n=1 Tax=Archocentrus centrarchus TaxID=63155 RepID=UPI0011EA1741|nr:macrophage mannose receptor 1-like [Archocentrus centrarchus]
MTNFTNWDTDEPNPLGDCVYKDKGKWKTDNCAAKHSFICYDGLVLVKENKTWEEALDHCRSLGGVDTASLYWNHRYDLATLITPEDLNTARKSAQAATTDEVWTGMRFLAGEWLWVGGEQMQYENIPSCPTDGSCGVLEKSGTAPFSTRDCQLRRNFFCYKRP